MKYFSDEDLIGFLLGALDPSEERAIQQALSIDVQLRNRLESLEEKLTGLPDRFVEIDPPPGLTEKTMNTISIVDATLGSEQPDSDLNDESSDPGETANHVPSSHSADMLSNDVRLDRSTVNPSPASTTTITRASGEHELQPGSRNWSAMDLVVGAAVCFVLATVLLPSIANSRFQSRLLNCQENLRTVGFNLASVADSFDGTLVTPEDNDQWQASLFVRKIVEAELGNGIEQFICPNDPGKESTAEICRQAWGDVSLVMTDARPPVPAGGTSYDTGYAELERSSLDEAVVSPAVVTQPIMPNTEIIELRKTEAACGSYGFPAPQVTDQGIQEIRVPASPYSVLCADAPCFDNRGFRSRNHAGLGQNVLLGDLSVQFIRNTSCLATGDHIYTNNLGKVQPGIIPGDNLIYRGVIDPSQQLPLNLR